MEVLFWLIICFLVALAIYFFATIFVYRLVFGLEIKEAIQKALTELFFWRHNDEDNNYDSL